MSSTCGGFSPNPQPDPRIASGLHIPQNQGWGQPVKCSNDRTSTKPNLSIRISFPKLPCIPHAPSHSALFSHWHNYNDSNGKNKKTVATVSLFSSCAAFLSSLRSTFFAAESSAGGSGGFLVPALAPHPMTTCQGRSYHQRNMFQIVMMKTRAMVVVL